MKKKHVKNRGWQTKLQCRLKSEDVSKTQNPQSITYKKYIYSKQKIKK